jgi:arylsulfatase A-like enzyme
MYTPTLASLAKRGLVFENAYAQPNCSPSRAALLTGYYPVHTGRQVWYNASFSDKGTEQRTMHTLFQNGIIKPREPTGLFTNFTLLPQHLKRLGYKTHLVGKYVRFKKS